MNEYAARLVSDYKGRYGFFAVLPFIAASIGVVVGGQVSDWLLRRTGNATLARKLPIIAGLFLASCIVAANFLDDDNKQRDRRV